jgi:nitroreductase
MNVTEAIESRHSTRLYTDKQISDEILRDIVRLAQLAPSWVNARPEHVYAATGVTLNQIRQQQATLIENNVVTNSDVPTMSRDKWSKKAQINMANWYDSIPKSIGPDWEKYNFDAASKLYNAPTILYLTLPKGHAEWSMYDIGSFAENILLAAKEKGIDSMTAYYLVMYPDMLRENLSIPEGERIIIGIALGYKDDDAIINGITSVREPVETILTVKK